MKGAVRKRGSTWSYYFDLGVVDGKRKKKEKGGFRTKKDAEKALAEALSKYNSTGTVFEPSQMLFSEFIDFYIKNYCEQNLKQKTVYNNNSRFKKIKKELGMYKLVSLTPAILQDYINSLKSNGSKKGTINAYYSCISSVLSYAVEPMHYILYNPMQNVKRPKFDEDNKEIIPLSNDDIEKLVNQCNVTDGKRIAILIAYNTGSRVSETLGLTWDDVDFEENTISFNKQLVYFSDTSCYKFTTLKTKSSGRKVHFGKTLRDNLLATKTMQEKNAELYGDYYNVSYIDENGIMQKCKKKHYSPDNGKRVNLVCIQENGTNVTYFSISYFMKKNNLHFHLLRHSHATLLIENGVNPKAVQARIGHSNITTTLQTYTHQTEKMDIEAMQKFEDATST